MFVLVPIKQFLLFESRHRTASQLLDSYIMILRSSFRIGQQLGFQHFFQQDLPSHGQVPRSQSKDLRVSACCLHRHTSFKRYRDKKGFLIFCLHACVAPKTFQYHQEPLAYWDHGPGLLKQRMSLEGPASSSCGGSSDTTPTTADFCRRVTTRRFH